MEKVKRTYFLDREKEKLIRLLQDHQIDPKVIGAFRKTPRHLFVRPQFLAEAYQDHPLPIGQGQVISQPSLVAMMTQALNLTGEEKVLEVGTGSGFQAAILSRLAKKVVSIERFDDLSSFARENLKNASVKNVRVITGDGSKGYPKEAPFEAIMLTAGSEKVPQPLQEQLAEGGRLVIPLGGRATQEVVLYRKESGRLVEKKSLTGARFVPLVGKHGWEENNA